MKLPAGHGSSKRARVSVVRATRRYMIVAVAGQGGGGQAAGATTGSRIAAPSDRCFARTAADRRAGNLQVVMTWHFMPRAGLVVRPQKKPLIQREDVTNLQYPSWDCPLVSSIEGDPSLAGAVILSLATFTLLMLLHDR